MIREYLLIHGVGEEVGFRWRGRDVTRDQAGTMMLVFGPGHVAA